MSSPLVFQLNPTGVQTYMNQSKKKKSMYDQESQSSSTMNFIIYNMSQPNNETFRCLFEAMVKYHKPVMLVLLERKMIEQNNLTNRLKFDS